MKKFLLLAAIAAAGAAGGAEPLFRMGVGTHATYYYGIPEWTAPLVRDMGMLSNREGFNWRAWQKTQEIKPMEMNDRHVALAPKIGLLPVYAVCGSSPVIGGRYPKTPEDIEAYLKFIRSLVTHYKGKIKYLQIWNEWEGGSGMDRKFVGQGDAKSYVNLLKKVYPVVKEIDPEIQVVSNSIMRGAGWVEEACRLGLLDCCDAYSLNLYAFNERGDAEVWYSKLLTQTAVARKYAKDGKVKPLIITETGWPTFCGPAGSTEEHSADNLAQVYLLARTVPELKILCWYELHDDGYRYDDQENNFGLMTPELTPKDGYYTAKSIAEVVQYGKFVKFLPTPDEQVRAMLFEMPGNRYTLALWSRRPEARTRVVLNRNGGEVKEIGFTIAGRETLKREWGFQDWAPSGRPKGFQRNKDHVDRDRYGLSITARPVLLSGVPKEIKIEEVTVQKRPPYNGGAKGFFPQEIVNVAFKPTGRETVLDLTHPRYFWFSQWGKAAHQKSDLSMTMKMTYDLEKLHIDFLVTDNRHVQKFPAHELWQGDSVQVVFASFDAENPAPQQATHYELGMDKDGKAIVQRDTSQHALSTPTQVRMTVSRKGIVTRYSVDFPFAELGVKEIEGNFPLAMSVVVNDNDDDARQRKGFLLWGDGVVSGKIDPTRFNWLYFRRNE